MKTILALMKNRQSSLWTYSTVIMVVIAGGLLSWWNIQMADRGMRERLLYETRMVAQAVDIEDVRGLTGNESDLNTPGYQNLKKQFAAIKQASKQCRFVYIMGYKSNRQLSILVDNESPVSPDYSPPGDEYREAVKGELDIFATGRENVVGPFQNRWGTWVSAFVPLFDINSDSLIAVFGMDVDASKWRREVLSAAAWPCIFTMATLVMLAMTITLFRSRRWIIKQQRSLQESEERYKRITESITDYVYTVQIQAGEAVSTEHGPGCLAVTGYSGEEFGKDPFLWLNMVPTEDRAQVIEQAKQATRGEKISPIIHRIIRRDGELRWVKNTIVYHRDENGKLLSYDGLIQDITERKVAEDTVKDSHAELLAIFDSIDEPVYVADIETYDLIFMNRILETSFGHPSGRKCYEQLQRRNTPCPYCTNDKIVKEYLGQSYVWEFQNETNGRWYKCVDKAIQWPDGRLVRYEMAIDITDRKLAENALRESRDLLDETQKLAKVGGWELYPDQGTIKWTSEMYRILGIDPGEIGASVDELVQSGLSCYDPEDRPIVEAAFQRCVNEGIPYEMEYPITNRNGQRLWIKTMAVPVTENGRVVRVSGNIIDITDRKKAEEELRNSDQRFRLLANLAPVGLIISNIDEKVLFCSQRFIDMFGYDINDMPSADEWWPLAYPDPTVREEIRSKWVTSLARARNEGIDVMPLECVVKCKDGGTLQVEIRVATTPDLNFIVFSDITARKIAEDNLQRTQFTMDHAYDSILWVDRDANIIYVNERACSKIGYTREELLHMKVFDIDPDFKPEGWEEHVKKLKREGSVRFQSRHVTKDGRYYPVEVTGNYLEYEGKFYSCAFDRDISERIQAEEEKSRLQEHLNQAQKMESVGRLAGGVAHDFNNMLGVILGHTGMALEHVDPEHPIYLDLIQIQKAAVRSENLTRQLLAFARKQTASPRILDLNNTVEGMLSMLRRLIGENIELSMIPGKNLGTIKMDPSQVDQIMANLCVNARDAISDTGKIIIATENVTLDEDFCTNHIGIIPGEFVKLSVSDNGCGMNEEVLTQLFEPFFTTKTIGKGTGLGLPTVYGIVSQNDGIIDVSSEVGKGTVFSLFFPRCHENASSEVESEIPKEVSNGHETILLVDDETMILEMATTMLKRQGYTVLAAGSPGDAIKLAENYAGKIHLLMTDVVMPGMNGRDLADKLLSLCPELKRLFMSGYTADVIAPHGMLDEGVAFIQKPFTMANLAGKVREVLKS